MTNLPCTEVHPFCRNPVILTKSTVLLLNPHFVFSIAPKPHTCQFKATAYGGLSTDKHKFGSVAWPCVWLVWKPLSFVTSTYIGPFSATEKSPWEGARNRSVLYSSMLKVTLVTCGSGGQNMAGLKKSFSGWCSVQLNWKRKKERNALVQIHPESGMVAG